MPGTVLHSRKTMKRIHLLTKTSNQELQKPISEPVLQDLPDTESQTIQGGGLLLPAVQSAREASR